MNFSLKPHQRVAHWVPGFVSLLCIWVVHPSVLCGTEHLLPQGDLQRGFVVVVQVAINGPSEHNPEVGKTHEVRPHYRGP